MRSPLTAHRIRVLLVEDDPIHRAIAERYLARLGEAVQHLDVASDLAGAHRAVESASPGYDVVLLDLTLPDSPLEDTLRALADLARDWGTRIVATSSLDDADVRTAVAAAPNSVFLPKDAMTTESLGAVLLRGGIDPAAAPAGSVAHAEFSGHAASSGHAANTGHSDHSGRGRAPGAPTVPTAADLAAGSVPPGPTGLIESPGDPGALERDRGIASRLHHDMNSWITNGTFRLAAIRGLVDRATAAVLAPHLDAIEQSFRALAGSARAARSYLIEETSQLRIERGDVIAQLAGECEDWIRGIKATRVAPTFEGSTGTVHSSPVALGWIAAILLSNADAHGVSQSAGDPIHVQFYGDEGRTVTVTDDGGPWRVDEASRLLEPGTVGSRGTPRAGMGLYRARRLMERLGGSLELVERKDVPGAYAVRLTFAAL